MTVPDTLQLRPPPDATTTAHLPACVAVAPTQLPPQHSVFCMHESLSCLQNDVAVLQMPSMQPFEQHCALSVQVLPDARQTPAFVEVQTFPVHLPLQQSALLAQASPSFLHWAATHLAVALQKPEQQSLSSPQGLVEPVVMHGPLRLPHWFGA